MAGPTVGAGRRPRWLAGVLALAGFMLSPLSWWNDALINIPLAWLLAVPVGRIAPQLFLPALLIAYWLTNLLGLWLLHIGGRNLLRGASAAPVHAGGWRGDLLIASVYTLLIVVLAWQGWLPLPN